MNLNKHKIFLEMCDTFSKLSKCVSKHVCSLIVKDDRIISSGINGTRSGFKNCNDIFDPNNFDRKKHHEFSKLYEIHSEINAIMDAAKRGCTINGATIYCNLEPCEECMKNISNSGIKTLIFKNKYDMNKNNENNPFCYMKDEFLSHIKIINLDEVIND